MHQLRQTGVSRCRDSKGGWDDKSLNKCHTAARKYFLLSLFQIPTGEESDADKGENDASQRKTLAKKDARDIYTKLQAGLDANTSRRELNEWGEANAERIRLLPEDWQDTLRMRYQEKMLDLQQREHAAMKAYLAASAISGALADSTPEWETANKVTQSAIGREHAAMYAVLTASPTTIPGAIALLEHVGQDQFLGEAPEGKGKDVFDETILSTWMHGEGSRFKTAAQELPLRLAAAICRSRMWKGRQQ